MTRIMNCTPSASTEKTDPSSKIVIAAVRTTQHVLVTAAPHSAPSLLHPLSSYIPSLEEKRQVEITERMVLHVLLMSKMPVLYLFRLSLLLWPFNLYLPLARQLPRVCVTLSRASTLFAFQLHQIVAAQRQGTQRFERAVRLVSEQLRLRPARRGANNARVDYSFPAFFALSL